MLTIPVSSIKMSMSKKQKNVLNKEFVSFCEWFMGNKLSINFRYDKSKTFFFSRMKSQPKLSISYGDHFLKQRGTVEYLECYLDFNLNGE